LLVLPIKLTIKTPAIINPNPIIVYVLGIWLNLTIPTSTVATMHNPANEA
jgi:hypothetical protein